MHDRSGVTDLFTAYLDGWSLFASEFGFVCLIGFNVWMTFIVHKARTHSIQLKCVIGHGVLAVAIAAKFVLFVLCTRHSPLHRDFLSRYHRLFPLRAG